jgi:hypothetical protein
MWQVVHLILDVIFLVLQLKHVWPSIKQVKPKAGESIWWHYGRIVLNNLWSHISAFIFCAYKLWSGEAICHDPAVTVLLAARFAAFAFTVMFPLCSMYITVCLIHSFVFLCR